MKYNTAKRITPAINAKIITIIPITKMNKQTFLHISFQHAPIIPIAPKAYTPIPTPNPIPNNNSINCGLMLANC